MSSRTELQDFASFKCVTADGRQDGGPDSQRVRAGFAGDKRGAVPHSSQEFELPEINQ